MAEDLNFCGIVIGNVSDKVRFSNLRKFNHILYPNIQSLCTGELARLYPPTRVAVDYSNNQAFAEYLEAQWHPSFTSMGSEHYGKWKTILPVKFSFESKLDMKQNSRQIHESGLIDYPDPLMCSSTQRTLINEMKDQLMREASTPTSRGLSFPKPDGYDNDLAIAAELMLKAARPYLKNFMHGTGKLIGRSLTREMTTRKAADSTGAEKITRRRLQNAGYPSSALR